MRYILFRGKTTERRPNWVYGFYTKDSRENHIIEVIGRKLFGITDIDKHRVAEETVGQYTGLRDKNENMIFEGDILRYTDPDGRHWKVLVKWRIQSCSFIFSWDTAEANKTITRYTDMRPDTYGDVVMISYVKVIGNIHDNPELLNPTL